MQKFLDDGIPADSEENLALRMALKNNQQEAVDLLLSVMVPTVDAIKAEIERDYKDPIVRLLVNHLSVDVNDMIDLADTLSVDVRMYLYQVLLEHPTIVGESYENMMQETNGRYEKMIECLEE